MDWVQSPLLNTTGPIVSLEKIAKYAKHFDLIILGEEGETLPFSETASQIFHKVDFKTLEQSAQEPLSCHLLIVCGSSDTLLRAPLRTVLASVQRLETIIFTPDFSNINIFRTALAIRASSVSNVPENDDGFIDELMKVFPSVIKKYNESIAENYQRHIIEHSNFLFCIHKEGKTIYANEALKSHFGVSTLREVGIRMDKTEIGKILQIPGSNQKIIPKLDESQDALTEYFVNTTPLRDGETLIGMFPLKISLQPNEKRLLNRMSFIEVMKDAFLMHHGENESIPIVMIHIENSDKIIDRNGENTYNDICREILALAQSHFGAEADIAQWHKDVYTVISEGSLMEDLIERLEEFQKDVTDTITVDNIAPALDSFVIDMRGIDLNKAIEIIDHIHQKQLLSADISNLVYHEISASRHEDNEKDQALHYLEKLMLSKSPVKLLNFYKGIRISTPGRLVKLSDGLVYIAIEKIQGYAMKLEQNTVIQGANLPYDLQANVKIVDVSKKITVLSQFQPLKASANNRQYTRIQSDHRMHVTMTSSKNVMAGTILDISIKSIACKISTSKLPPDIGTSVVLQFNLPQVQGDEVMVSMNVSGKIQYVQKDDEFTKIVVVLELEEPYESYLIDYIYNRQQALINEIKMIANKF